MRTGRALALALLAWGAASCARMTAPPMPPPARPAVLVPMGFDQAFGTLSAMVEARGLPVLVTDEQFGTLRTDWVEYAPGDVDLEALADCGLPADAPEPAVRVRYGFDVRKRANRASVAILAHYQADRHPGFEERDHGWADCRSTGEWERMIEQSLTQRTVR